MPRLRFAGQITGCEGYVESAAIGLLAGRFAAAERLRRGARAFRPPTTAHGALLAHITGGHVETIDAGPRSFQPMNVNFGLFPPLAQSPSRSADGARLRGTAKAMAKRRALTARALADLDRGAATAPTAALARGQVSAVARSANPTPLVRGDGTRPRHPALPRMRGRRGNGSRRLVPASDGRGRCPRSRTSDDRPR